MKKVPEQVNTVVGGVKEQIVEGYYWLNQRLKGLRGIILVWIGVALTYAESIFNLTGTVLSSGHPLISDWKGAVIVAVLLTIKNAVTDVGKKR